MGEMPPVRVPANLPSLVKTAFAKARASGDVLYFPTEVAILKPSSIPFQLRFSPALASKPKGPPKPKDPNAKPFNPFESPLPSMTVSELPPSHVLVLNKFAVVPEHFILATKTVKPQTHVLEQDDVATAYACIQSYLDNAQHLFAFFNSGTHSGASQPHRHLQLLPVESMKDGLEKTEAGDEWSVLTDRLHTQGDGLPFTVFSTAIKQGMSPKELHDAYLGLYRRAVQLVLPHEGPPPSEGEAKLSYNLGLTSSYMALMPRVADGASIKNKEGKEVGAIGLNGTVLAGTALVKNAAEWDALRDDPDLLLGVLKQIGIPRKEGISGNL